MILTVVSASSLAVLKVLLALLFFTPSTDPVTSLPEDPAGRSVASPAFSPEKASFAIKAKGIAIPYSVFSIFVMPGEAVSVEVMPDRQDTRFALEASEGGVYEDANAWVWEAPRRSGHYQLSVVDEASGESILLNAFVMVPFDHQEASLNGYRIGQYQAKPLKGNPAYVRPQGFVEVTPANEHIQVAPHFTLGQFVCKQPGEPKYLALQEALLLKLERLLEAVNNEGIAASTLHVMSAYRTPSYNWSIGNRTVYSRHLYGDAADVFVDVDGDNYMDDLNGDGVVDKADARLLAKLVEEHAEHGDHHHDLVGGIGIYSPASHRGPFVHVDVRGHKARW